jgi:hypothetical protein
MKPPAGHKAGGLTHAEESSIGIWNAFNNILWECYEFQIPAMFKCSSGRVGWAIPEPPVGLRRVPFQLTSFGGLRYLLSIIQERLESQTCLDLYG